MVVMVRLYRNPTVVQAVLAIEKREEITPFPSCKLGCKYPIGVAGHVGRVVRDPTSASGCVRAADGRIVDVLVGRRGDITDHRHQLAGGALHVEPVRCGDRRGGGRCWHREGADAAAKGHLSGCFEGSDATRWKRG